jgi:hypothetical protein
MPSEKTAFAIQVDVWSSWKLTYNGRMSAGLKTLSSQSWKAPGDLPVHLLNALEKALNSLYPRMADISFN